MKHYRLLTLAATIAVASCASELQEGDKLASAVDVPSAQVSAALSSSSATVQGPAATVKGFKHASANSRFAIGAVLRTEQAGKYHRLVGTNGVIATTDSGALLSVLDGNKMQSVLFDVGPLTNDPEVHHRAVLDYFRTSGLPADQMGSTHVLTLGTREGSVMQNPSDVAPVLRAYTTVIDRRISGVRVEGSYASASFNAAGEVVSEAVYWPELPRSVVDEAIKMKSDLSSDTAPMARLKNRLAQADQYDSNEVIIRHTPFTDESLQIHSAVVFRGAKVQARYLKADGSEAEFTNGAPVGGPAPLSVKQ